MEGYWKIKSLPREPMKGDFVIFYLAGQVYDQGVIVNVGKESGVMELEDSMVNLRVEGLTFDLIAVV